MLYYIAFFAYQRNKTIIFIIIQWVISLRINIIIINNKNKFILLFIYSLLGFVFNLLEKKNMEVSIIQFHCSHYYQITIKLKRIPIIIYEITFSADG